MEGRYGVKASSFILLFLIMVMYTTVVSGMSSRENHKQNSTQQRYIEAFQTAVDDTGDYLSRLEAQQQSVPIRYGKEKQISVVTNELFDVFINQLARQFQIENDPVAVHNLKLHIPAMVVIGYDGYTLITLDDSANPQGHRLLSPVLWPIRPYVYMLQNHNPIYFTLDDQAKVYDRSSNQFIQANQSELRGRTHLQPLSDVFTFREVRQETITQLIEQDLGGAFNRHMELIKRLGLHIELSLPKGLQQQSIQHIGFMAFIQGYPLPSGELLEQFAFGGGTVARSKDMMGTLNGGRKEAFPTSCVPTGAVSMEQFHNASEAANKGYYILSCQN